MASVRLSDVVRDIHDAAIEQLVLRAIVLALVSSGIWDSELCFEVKQLSHLRHSVLPAIDGAHDRSEAGNKKYVNYFNDPWRNGWDGTVRKSNKIAQKPLVLLGDWSVTVGAFGASFGH